MDKFEVNENVLVPRSTYLSCQGSRSWPRRDAHVSVSLSNPGTKYDEWVDFLVVDIMMKT